MPRPFQNIRFWALNNNYNDSYNRSDYYLPYALRYHKTKVNMSLFKHFGFLLYGNRKLVSSITFTLRGRSRYFIFEHRFWCNYFIEYFIVFSGFKILNLFIKIFPAKFIYFLLHSSLMLDLECRSCGYKFRKDKAPARCPYCSAEGKVGLLKTAQDLLDETLGEASVMDGERKRRN